MSPEEDHERCDDRGTPRLTAWTLGADGYVLGADGYVLGADGYVESATVTGSQPFTADEPFGVTGIPAELVSD